MAFEWIDVASYPKEAAVAQIVDRVVGGFSTGISQLKSGVELLG